MLVNDDPLPDKPQPNDPILDAIPIAPTGTLSTTIGPSQLPP